MWCGGISFGHALRDGLQPEGHSRRSTPELQMAASATNDGPVPTLPLADPRPFLLFFFSFYNVAPERGKRISALTGYLVASYSPSYTPLSPVGISAKYSEGVSVVCPSGNQNGESKVTPEARHTQAHSFMAIFSDFDFLVSATICRTHEWHWIVFFFGGGGSAKGRARLFLSTALCESNEFDPTFSSPKTKVKLLTSENLLSSEIKAYIATSFEIKG